MFISDCYSFFFDLQAFEESFRLVAIESVVSEIAIFVSPTGNNEVVGSIGLTDNEISPVWIAGPGRSWYGRGGLWAAF